MALVTERVKANSEKCKECILQKFMEFTQYKVEKEKNSELYENTKALTEVFSKLSCNVCPNGKDFEKIYGMTPFQYFTQGKKAV